MVLWLVFELKGGIEAGKRFIESLKNVLSCSEYW